jgi:acyl-CoA synthetase (AMP-forming)/AMP-acid ligase II
VQIFFFAALRESGSGHLRHRAMSEFDFEKRAKASKPIKAYGDFRSFANVEDAVIREIGPMARPRRIMIVPDMPKTRSGKIIRRVLAAISNNEDAGDISTLANPEIVEEIRQMKS